FPLGTAGKTGRSGSATRAPPRRPQQHHHRSGGDAGRSAVALCQLRSHGPCLGPQSGHRENGDRGPRPACACRCGKGRQESAGGAAHYRRPSEEERVLQAHKEWVRCLALSQDGTRLLTGDDHGLAILWAVPEMKEVRRLEVPGWIRAVAWSPDV